MSSSGSDPIECVECTRKDDVTTSRRREDAFDGLFREFFPRIVALTRPVTRDSGLAEDVAQETLSRMHDRSGSLDFREPIWPWLRTVAMHLAIDQVRRCRHETSTEPHLVGEGDRSSGADDVHWCDDGPRLIVALNRLPPRQRLAITLRYLGDEDSSTAAVVLGLSKRAFEQLLFRARRNLAAGGV